MGYLTAFPCAEFAERKKSGGDLSESHLKPAEHQKWKILKKGDCNNVLAATYPFNYIKHNIKILELMLILWLSLMNYKYNVIIRKLIINMYRRHRIECTQNVKRTEMYTDCFLLNLEFPCHYFTDYLLLSHWHKSTVTGDWALKKYREHSSPHWLLACFIVPDK